MSEALAGDAERAGGLLHLVRLVPRRLSVLHLRYFHVLAHPVKVLLGLLELPDVSDKHRGDKFKMNSGSQCAVRNNLLSLVCDKTSELLKAALCLIFQNTGKALKG